MKHPRHRLPPENYTGYGLYFLTLCTAEHRKHFLRTEIVNAFVELMHQQFQKHNFSIYAFCFMPDHCHLLAVSESSIAELSKAVRAFKGVAATVARKSGIHELWQRDYYEHIVRSSEDIGAVVAYILQNPVRAGLAKDWRDWPFSGTAMFGWKKVPIADHGEPGWKPKPQRDKPAAT